jgi:choline dehydrogenase-like flavoprotein
MQKNKKKVIIIGGGTAGLTIANHIQKYFDVTVVEKSKYKKYPWIYRIPLMIGLLFRNEKMDHVTKRTFVLADDREIPFYESNLWGGASIMNGCVHVFGFKSKWKSVLEKFGFTHNDLLESNDKIYSFDVNEKHKMTLMNAHQNVIDEAFVQTLNSRGFTTEDMSFAEKEACGPLQNTVRKYFRTSVLSLIDKTTFKISLEEKVESILFDDKGNVTGVKTNKGIKEADYVILSAGVIGTNDLLLREKYEKKNKLFNNLPIGKRIQDHTNIRVNVLANQEIGSLNEIYNSLLKKLLLALKHFSGKSTVMRGTSATSAAYLDLDKDGEIDTRIQILQFSENGRHGSSGSMFGTEEPSFSISITAIHPESEGEITLDGDTNIVNPRFLSSQKDVEILKLALEYCIDLLKSSPISDYVLKIEDEEYIKNNPEKYIHDTMFSGHHLIGGLQDSINSNFEVQNTKGLYVCDASIFDKFVASNIHSSVVLLADMFAKKFITKNFSS